MCKIYIQIPDARCGQQRTGSAVHIIAKHWHNTCFSMVDTLRETDGGTDVEDDAEVIHQSERFSQIRR